MSISQEKINQIAVKRVVMGYRENGIELNPLTIRASLSLISKKLGESLLDMAEAGKIIFKEIFFEEMEKINAIQGKKKDEKLSSLVIEKMISLYETKTNGVTLNPSTIIEDVFIIAHILQVEPFDVAEETKIFLKNRYEKVLAELDKIIAEEEEKKVDTN